MNKKYSERRKRRVRGQARFKLSNLPPFNGAVALEVQVLRSFWCFDVDVSRGRFRFIAGDRSTDRDERQESHRSTAAQEEYHHRQHQVYPARRHGRHLGYPALGGHRGREGILLATRGILIGHFCIIGAAWYLRNSRYRSNSIQFNSI